jgi:catechol 2,3-dioxygenase-like lactoylglutathione lyase family enzyme
MPTLSTPQPARHPSPTVRARRLAYLLWERPDLDRAAAFLHAFGLQTAAREPDTLYLRGTAAAPFCYVVRRAAQARFVGFALELASRADLERVAREVPGAGAIEPLASPGGGEVVRLVDPSGFRVEAVFGQQPYPALEQRAPIARFNTAAAQPRVDATQRVPHAAPAVVKLGHVVMEVAAFQATCGWYTRHFGFIPSDVQVLPDGSPAVTFMRLDLGDTPADHHTLALAQAPLTRYSHSAFELVDADAVGMGQRVLRERGFHHAW